MTTIMVTGATDGLGLAAAQRLAGQGHRLVLHGRDEARLDRAAAAVADVRDDAVAGTVLADLSDLDDVGRLADAAAGLGLDVLVNNAGVLRTGHAPADGLDVRFVVNTIAPYLLTRRLLGSLPDHGRVVNLSSAAQAPVDLDALAGRARLDDDMAAYAQSKLALTMWSRHVADEIGPDRPAVIALNPGSLLATKMVKEGFGIAGHDIAVGADVIARAAVGDDFAGATGRYYDNDAKRFAPPHADAADATRNAALVQVLDDLLARLG
jgi:NAD(P)-dependent dehydrogenase (short-subunit alcohol dehydrogenase family)